jgi:hypothetical protein
MGPAMLSDPLNLGVLHADISVMDLHLRQDMQDVEALEAELRHLVAERQRLRDFGAGRLELERNRSRLVTAQLDLGRALIRRHLPTAS